MNKTSLEKLIYKNYLKTSLVSIVCIEVILVVIYFITNYNIINQTISFVFKELETTTTQTIEEKKFNLSTKLKEIEAHVKILQNDQQKFFSNNDFLYYGKIDFDYAQNGMYYKTTQNGGSSVVVSNRTEIDDELIKELIQTEIFDMTFKPVVDYNNDIIAAYYNSRKNYNRYYPALENVYDIFPSDLRMLNYSFYFLADERHNPFKKVVWTEVYLDPAKKGWLISAIAPIYKGDQLEGVTGVDIQLKKFIDDFLNLNLPYDGKSFVLDSNGKILGMQKEIEELIGKSELEEYEYKEDEKIYTTIHKSQSFNINNRDNKELAKTILDAVKKPSSNFEFKINGKNYLIFTQKIKSPSWSIISIVEKDRIVSKIRSLEEKYKELGYLIIGSIIIFYILFFIYLNIKARKFVNEINTPIQDIVKLTKDLGKKEDLPKLKSNNILEIDELNTGINEVVEELNERTKNLIEEESKRIYNERLANTDSLTGAFNRRYLEDFTLNYLKIVKRENRNLALLIIDLDDFKTINDNHGHHKGDDLLVDLVKIIKKSVRDNDLIVRYGGDEFIVLLPDTTKESAHYVASKIKSNIREFSDENYKFTVSIGTANYILGDQTILDIIKRADNSLYEAKKNGKDKIV